MRLFSSRNSLTEAVAPQPGRKFTTDRPRPGLGRLFAGLVFAGAVLPAAAAAAWLTYQYRQGLTLGPVQDRTAVSVGLVVGLTAVIYVLVRWAGFIRTVALAFAAAALLAGMFAESTAHPSHSRDVLARTVASVRVDAMHALGVGEHR